MTLIACNPVLRDNPLPASLYLGWDEAERTQLYKAMPGRNPENLTEHPSAIIEFAVSPAQDQVAFTTTSQDGRSQIWLVDTDGNNMRQILDCADGQTCGQLNWYPDGRRILYERMQDDEDNSPRLWWLDTINSETVPLIAQEVDSGQSARFSPNGEWLSYFAPQLRSLRTINLLDGREQLFISESGAPAAWHPDSRQLLYSNIEIVTIHGSQDTEHDQHSHDFSQAVHLFLADTSNGELRRLSPDLAVDDGSPAWSPDGKWIAFGRRPPRTGAGRQLWLMRADGDDPQALTDDLNFSHGPTQWSADGRYLLFQRTDLRQNEPLPAVWALDIESSKMIRIAETGMMPVWLEK